MFDLHTRFPFLLFAVLPALVGAAPAEIAHRDGANLQRPQWSPDGSQLSYEANFHDKKVIELFVGSAEGKSFRQVRSYTRGTSAISSGFAGADSGGQVLHDLSWGPPDTERFVFVSSDKMGDYDLHLSGAGPFARSPAADGGPTWSPTGQHIAFTSSRTGQGDLYLVQTDQMDGEPTRLTSNPEASELYAAWSPNGKQLVYVSHGKQGDNIWWLSDLDAAPIRLTSWSGSQTRPVFSPNGESVAFYAAHEVEGRLDLYTLTLGSTSPPQLMAKDVVPNGAGPVWSPDGKYLLFVCNDDDRFDPICTVRIDQAGFARALALDTVGHGDLDVTSVENGAWRIAYVAQGRTSDKTRSFKRLFEVVLTPPKAQSP